MNHTKRYMVVFQKWNKYKFHEDKTEYDTLNEALEETKLLEEVYIDTPKPRFRFNDYVWGESYLGEALWGYVILDFEEEKVIKWGHDQLKYYKKDGDIRAVKDKFFRKYGEVPDNYKWDFGEYDGWLQYRWGNGKNSIEYREDAMIDDKNNKSQCVRRCNVKKKKYRNFTYNEKEEEELDKLNEEILAINTN